MYDATKLAAAGRFRCRRCKRIGKQEEGIVIAFAGNVLFAMHPECMTGPVRVEKDGNSIRIRYQTPSTNRIVLARDIADSDLQIAKPQVARIKL